MRNKSIYILAAVLLMSFSAMAQGGSDGVEMADELRSSGKIYVVVVSLLLILIGLLVYMFVTERRLKKLEEEIRNK